MPTPRPSDLKALVRNPLGVIGLFICFVYSLAALVLGVSKDLESGHKWALILFICLFPVVVLAAFVWLVSKHHSKLYAPSDFEDDDGFYRLQSQAEKEARAQANARELAASEPAQNKPRKHVHPLATDDGDESLRPDSLKDAYKEAERLALQELESHVGSSITPEIVLNGENGERVFLDGAIRTPTKFIGYEVKMSRDGTISQKVVDGVLANAIRMRSIVHAHSPSTIVAMVVAVVILDGPPESEERIWSTIQRAGDMMGFVPDIRIMRLSGLRAKYREMNKRT